jgi:hypothetical protein
MLYARGYLEYSVALAGPLKSGEFLSLLQLTVLYSGAHANVHLPIGYIVLF